MKQPVIGPILNKAFQARRMALKNFSEKMREQQQLVTPPEMIQNSLIHMHSNRLLGRDPKKEAQACLYAFHTLSIINRHNVIALT